MPLLMNSPPCPLPASPQDKAEWLYVASEVAYHYADLPPKYDAVFEAAAGSRNGGEASLFGAVPAPVPAVSRHQRRGGALQPQQRRHRASVRPRACARERRLDPLLRRLRRARRSRAGGRRFWIGWCRSRNVSSQLQV